MSQDGATYNSPPSPEKGKVHFVTGATGLLGSEYVYNVLTDSSTARCALLIFAKKQRAAEIKVNDLMHYLFGSGETYKKMRKRVDTYVGDIRQKRFGLERDTWQSLCASVSYIFHAASNSNLADSEEALNAVNVMGTVSAVHFAKQCPKLIRMMHVSTAYVSGTKKGMISPEELDMDRPVSDAYQMSKRVGEKIVRKHLDSLPIVILRPSTLVGHSKLGRTNSYKAFYYPTRMLVFGHRIIYPASSNGKIEAVPADWAASVALKLLKKKGIEGRCFHLTLGTRAYSMPQVKRIILKSLHKQGAAHARIRVVPRRIYHIFIAPMISIIYPNGRSVNRDFRLLSNYTCIDRIYDNRDTFRAIDGDHNQLPGLEGYYDKLCQYALTNRWQKLKAPDWLHRLNDT